MLLGRDGVRKATTSRSSGCTATQIAVGLNAAPVNAFDAIEAFLDELFSRSKLVAEFDSTSRCRFVCSRCKKPNSERTGRSCSVPYVDSKLPDHVKIFKAGALIGEFGPARALAMYMAGICYAWDKLTDGFIPDAYVKGFASHDAQPELVARALCSRKVRLWHRTKGGYRIHDYHDHNTAAATIKVKRDKKKKQKAAERAAKKAAELAQERASNSSPAESVSSHKLTSKSSRTRVRVPVDSKALDYVSPGLSPATHVATSRARAHQVPGSPGSLSSTDQLLVATPARVLPLTRTKQTDAVASARPHPVENPKPEEPAHADPTTDRIEAALRDRPRDSRGDADDRRDRLEGGHQTPAAETGVGLSDGPVSDSSGDDAGRVRAEEDGAAAAAARTQTPGEALLAGTIAHLRAKLAAHHGHTDAADAAGTNRRGAIEPAASEVPTDSARMETDDERLAAGERR